MLAPLDNEVFFKKAFTNKIVFEKFVYDIFGKKVSVKKIETEKEFQPKSSYINIKIDVYAETVDNRFIIEIQKIAYDYNFDRFLHYFLAAITQQQKRANTGYDIKKTVLAVIVLTQPYKIHNKTGMVLKDSVMSLDFDMKNSYGDLIRIWKHNLIFLNSHSKYEDKNLTDSFRDWLHLIRQSIVNEVNFKLNLNNTGIAKAVKLIKYDNLNDEEIAKAQLSEAKRRKRMKDKKDIKEKIERMKKKYKIQLEEKDLKLEEKDKLIKMLQEQLKNKNL